MARTCVADCYREHADDIESGARPAPVNAVVIELRETDRSVVVYGATENLNSRECLQVALRAISALSTFAARINAESSN